VAVYELATDRAAAAAAGYGACTLRSASLDVAKSFSWTPANS